VTGAGSRGAGIGNGRAVAILFARHGAKVALLDIDRRSAEETAGTIDREGGVCMVVPCDVTDEAACGTAVEKTVAAWGRLDVLVNNVGVTGPPGTAAEVDAGAWDEALRTNVTSMMLMAKHAIPPMREGGGGSIVNISSLAGLLGGHPALLYPTSKAAVIGLTRAMAAHHGREGIRVNCVAPGAVTTPMVEARGLTPELRAARLQQTLLGTEGSAWDTAHAVLYLASDESRWVTGAVLPVDAGATAAIVDLPVVPLDGIDDGGRGA
jgi:NAD(P)-dependent dehydrogenase (short-subunit alcohol dehydrogenase family)